MSSHKLSSTFIHQGWNIKYGILGNKNSMSIDDSSIESKTVVFIHGTPWSSVVFEPVAKAILARGNHQVLLYDLAGYGESQQLQSACKTTTHNGLFRGDTSVKMQANILSALLAHLKLDGKDRRRTPAVIAHDIAGAIALRTHLIHGCEFESLLLLDTNAVLPWGDGFYKLVRSQPDPFLQLPPSIFESMVMAVVRTACFRPDAIANGWEDKLTVPWISADKEIQDRQLSFVRQIAQTNDADVAEMLDEDLYHNVRCEVKIIWGAEDKWIPKDKMIQLADKLGHCLKEFVTIPEAGHLVMLDQPERVAVEIYDWLSR